MTRALVEVREAEQLRAAREAIAAARAAAEHARDSAARIVAAQRQVRS